MSKFTFKYFEDVLKNARFTEEKCQSCGTNEFCLEGVYFHDDVESVCLECLKKGKYVVNLQENMEQEIEDEINERNQND